MHQPSFRSVVAVHERRADRKVRERAMKDMLLQVEPLIPALRRYARALLRDRAAADDRVQDCPTSPARRAQNCDRVKETDVFRRRGNSPPGPDAMTPAGAS
ncbi:hypothetical protein SAMN05443247_05549 [Bradyrhizobium erythrophlei]|jgi:hypothetical protein|nr:hypothetical protein SAMN05443247_05549 [Bradyrhizobium erythrophlei]